MMHAMLRMGGYAEETIHAAGPKAYHDVLMSTPPGSPFAVTACVF